ncbi:MAG: hypothetical protein ABL934_12480 [Lysobacteraceae bacterium]
MGVSKIFLFSNVEEAQEKFAQYKHLENFNTLLIGPTDIFRITGQSPNKIEWTSGADRDWYMVIVTEAVVWTAGDGVVEGPD